MKILFTLILSSLFSVSAFAVSGQYVCEDTCKTNGTDNTCTAAPEPADIAAALNEMKCDTSKPFAMSSTQGDDQHLLVTICCVQK